MYSWNIPDKPLPDFDGKIHVDADRRIYQWSHRYGTWTNKNHWYLKEVGQVTQEMFGRGIGQTLVGAMNSVIINEWDELYKKAFVRIEMINSGATYYVANLTRDELDEYLKAITPTGTGGFTGYSDIVSLRVFQVVDPTIGITRTGHSNILYALMRGTHSYNKRSGRDSGSANSLTNEPLTSQTGFSSKMQNGRFADNWHVDVAMKSITEFFGILNAPSDDDSSGVGNNIFNFSRVRDNMYHLPKVGTMISLAERWWYNVPENKYERITEKISASIGNPKFFGNVSASNVRGYYPMNVLKGNFYLGEGWTGVVVYPLSGATSEGAAVKAFLIKPYGVDCVGLGLSKEFMDSDKWSIFSENTFPDSFTKKHKLVTARWDLNLNNLITFRVNDAIRFGRGNTSSMRNIRGDSNAIPKRINFFLQNVDSGVRTELLGSGLQIVRHKNCMPVGVLPAYK